MLSPEISSSPNILPLPQPSPSDLHMNPFGDPFVSMTDPLLQELNADTNSSHFSTAENNANNNNRFLVPKVVLEDDQIKSQCSIFPRIRISHSNIIHESSPCNSPAMSAHVLAAAAAASPRGIINANTNSPRNCLLVDGNTFSSEIQISSPRNVGLKRRYNIFYFFLSYDSLNAHTIFNYHTHNSINFLFNNLHHFHNSIESIAN